MKKDKKMNGKKLKSKNDPAMDEAAKAAAARAKAAVAAARQGPDGKPLTDKEVIENLQSQLIQLTHNNTIMQRTAQNVADQRNKAQNEAAEMAAQASVLADQLKNTRDALENKSKEATAAIVQRDKYQKELEDLQVAFINLQQEYDGDDEDLDEDEISADAEDEDEDDDDDEDSEIEASDDTDEETVDPSTDAIPN